MMISSVRHMQDSMKVKFLLIVLFIVSNKNFVYAEEYHTLPDCWKVPRIYQSKFEESYNERILIKQIRLERLVKEKKNHSKNQAYWYSITSPDTTKPSPWSSIITIYNERSYLTQITFIDHASYGSKASWINEKLLYIRIWWGRILATDLIWDTEQEKFMYREMSIWGKESFQQFQQMKHIKKESVKCPNE